MERTLAGDPAILRGGNIYYITGWPDPTALKRIVLSAIKKAKLEFFELPNGVRVRRTSKERFWFNYSSTVQKAPISNLRPGEVHIERF